MTYSKALRAEIVGLARAGRTQADLADEFGPSLKTIARWTQEDDPKERRRLVVTHPDVAAQFAADRNPGIDLARLGTGSKRLLCWCCAAGHVWAATVVTRTAGRRACPMCAGRGLAETHPELIAAIVSDIDGAAVDVESLTTGSGRRLRWRCDAGHVWVAPINDRVAGRGCPRCAGRHSETMAITHPQLMAQLAADRNPGVDLAALTAGSQRRLWWRCEQGHGGRRWSPAAPVASAVPPAPAGPPRAWR